MKPLPTDEHEEERGRSAERPDLVLNGVEEHPLLPPALDPEIDE